MAVRKINGLSFPQWIKLQSFRDDPTGDLARDLCSTNALKTATTSQKVLELLNEVGSVEALKAGHVAVSEWEAGVVSVKPKAARIKKNEQFSLSKKILTSGLNHLIRSDALSLKSTEYFNEISVQYDAGGVPGLIRARSIGYGEVFLAVCLWPNEYAKEWMGTLLDDSKALLCGGAICQGHVERQNGQWLQISRDINDVVVNKFSLGGLRDLPDEAPLGFRQSGRLM